MAARTAAAPCRWKAASFAGSALLIAALTGCAPDGLPADAAVAGDRAGGDTAGAGGTVGTVDQADHLSGRTVGAPADTALGGSEPADLARGEVLSYACRACHGLAPGDESPIGPSLAGVFGRPAATVEGFDYSPALRESGIVWTPHALDEWLAQPGDFLPGNNMAFAGFRSAQDRRDLIAYLLEQTRAASAR